MNRRLKAKSEAEPIVPRQRRSRDSHRRILASAERILRTHGLAEFSLPRVSAQSKISVGGIYRRFKDKESLVLAVQERVYARMDEEYCGVIAGALSGGRGFQAQLDLLISGIANLLNKHAPIIKAIVEASWEYSSVAGRGTLMFERHRRRFTSAVLNYHRTAVCHRAPKHAIDFCFSCIYELVASRCGFGRRVRSDLSNWPTFVRDLQCLCFCYLTQSQTGKDNKRAATGG